MSTFTPGQVSVLIGHLPERHQLLSQVVAGYEREGVLEVRTRTGMSCGGAYNDLARTARGSVLLFAADDQVPHPGAIAAGLATLNAGAVPVSRLYSSEGDPVAPGYDDADPDVELDWTRAFLLTAGTFRDVGPFLDLSWYLDNDYSQRLRDAGRRLVSCPGFAFTHLHGDQGWLADGEQERQLETYRQAQAGRVR